MLTVARAPVMSSSNWLISFDAACLWERGGLKQYLAI